MSIEENPHKLLKLQLKFQEKQPMGVTNNKSKRGREGGGEGEKGGRRSGNYNLQ